MRSTVRSVMASFTGLMFVTYIRYFRTENIKFGFLTKMKVNSGQRKLTS